VVPGRRGVRRLSRAAALAGRVRLPGLRRRSGLADRGVRTGAPVADLYAVTHGRHSARHIGTGWLSGPAADGTAVWVLAYTDRSHCALRLVGLNGRVRVPARPAPCWWDGISAGGAAGIVVRDAADHNELIDPVSQ
jgi:hypothetical protein